MNVDRQLENFDGIGAVDIDMLELVAFLKQYVIGVCLSLFPKTNLARPFRSYCTSVTTFN